MNKVVAGSFPEQSHDASLVFLALRVHLRAGGLTILPPRNECPVPQAVLYLIKELSATGLSGLVCLPFLIGKLKIILSTT